MPEIMILPCDAADAATAAAALTDPSLPELVFGGASPGAGVSTTDHASATTRRPDRTRPPAPGVTSGPADPRAALDAAAAVRASHDGRAAALAGAWDEAAVALRSSAERRAALVARGGAPAAAAVRGWSDVAVLAAATDDAVAAADALARARAALDGRPADPSVGEALDEVTAWLAGLAAPQRSPSDVPPVTHRAAVAAGVDLLDLGVDDTPEAAPGAATITRTAPLAVREPDPVAPGGLAFDFADDTDPFAAFGLGAVAASPTPVDASALVPALAIEPAVVPVPAVADRATAEPIDGGLARDEATRDAPVGPVAVGDQPAWDDAAWDAPSATAAPELSSDLTFLDLEGPLRTWELPVGNTGVALACPVPAASARKPLAPPLAEALRTDGASSGGAHGGERNAAVDAVVALTAARDEPGGLRGLLRRITRR